MKWIRVLSLVLLAVAVFIHLATGSSTTLFNNTGEEAVALRVEFDQPVTIVRMGEAFGDWSSEEDGYAVLFSKGAVASWGNFYFFWEPEDGSIVCYEWLAELHRPSLPDDPVQRAAVIHERAWEDVVGQAREDKFYKHALYTSRVLAVKHPEIYLQGDALFVEHITTQQGFAAAYEEQAPHADGFYSGFPGPPFSFDQVDYSTLRTVLTRDLYPAESPFLTFLDRRALSVASCLKTAFGIVTELEKAFIYYFERREELDALPFIVYCDNERAYLSIPQGLFSIRDWKNVDTVDGNPILIFNEESVWYPLMDRDDTGSDSSLEAIAEKYATESRTPELTGTEQQLIEKLQSVTELEDSNALAVATFSAVPGLVYESPLFHEAGKELVPNNYPLDIWRYSTYYQVHLASYLSPFAAYLARRIQNADWKSMIDLTNEWHVVYRTDHGYIWPRVLVMHTADSMMRNRYGHCVQHATSISAVLDLAGVTNYHFDTNPNGYMKGGHSFVSIPELGCIISNGVVETELHGTVLDTGTPFEGNQIWNTLRYAASGDRWAAPFIRFYCGNWPPSQLAHKLEYLESLYSDEIHGYTSGQGEHCMDVLFCKRFVHSDKFIPGLRGEQSGWQPFEYP